MTKADGKSNFGAMLDTQLPEDLERSIRDCLVVRPVQFQPEALVRQQCKDCWKRDIDDLITPQVCMYNQKPDGRFECRNLRECYEAELAKYTKEYLRMSYQERALFDHQKKAKQELFALKKARAKSNIANDLESLKREANDLDRDDEKKQKNRSFNKI